MSLTKVQKRKIATWLTSGQLYKNEGVSHRPLGTHGLETIISLNGFKIESSGWYSGLRHFSKVVGDYEGLLASLGWIVSKCPKCNLIAGLKETDNLRNPKCGDCKGHKNTSFSFFHL